MKDYAYLNCACGERIPETSSVIFISFGAKTTLSFAYFSNFTLECLYTLTTLPLDILPFSAYISLFPHLDNFAMH